MNEENNSPVPSNESVFAEAFAAATGTDTSSETLETVDTQDTSSELETETPEVEEVDATDETEQELSADSENSEDPDGDSTDLSETIEEVTVKGKDGKRRNIKVDFSDRAKIKKYVQKAANAVRLQSERDALQAQVSKLEESQQVVSNLQNIVDTEGFEGLINHLNADNGGFDAWMKQKLDRHELRQHASEDELRYLDEQDKTAKLQKQLDLIEKRNQEREDRVAQDREKAELDRLASEINPIYFKYTFDGKLGDSVAEQRYNKAMYRDVAETLDSLAEEGVNITPQIIEREFRSYASPLLKGMNRKVRQNTKKAIDKKKAEATTHAQQQVRKGYSNQDSINDAMNDRNWAQSLGKLWAAGKLK